MENSLESYRDIEFFNQLCSSKSVDLNVKLPLYNNHIT